MKHSVIWLSHPLSVTTPSYGGGEGMNIEPMTRITAGDTANTSRYIMPNHMGTHIDAPHHFFDSGATVMDYPPEFWIFDNPLLVDVPGKDGYLISSKDVNEKLTPETDLLLLRTGYEIFRGKSRYWQHNPGLAPELGTWIRKYFPNVRAVGMDVISVTSYHHREKGREAHRLFLDPNGHGNPVILIEDMALGQANVQLRRVIVSPLRVEKTDGGPCNISGFPY